ncbi:MAG TPA: FIST N-terminal domain-containing protein [Pirellulaceae bacterium]|nr:FIST N-terminal domain-containing protein [Pirellulaceae bacterium]HMO92046.1 FIST N-terminal domain-containing protein [Pirellulaceae bacterium]HMP68845.1 FIST N-terminal domain-containing protein [Pirellulaceae bacterium]
MASANLFKAATVSAMGEQLSILLERATGDLLDHLDANVDLVFVFVTSHLANQLDDHVHLVSERLGTKHVYGCTAESVLCQGTEFEREPAISIWAASMPGASITSTILKFDPHSDGGAFIGWPDEWLGEWEESTFMVAIADPYSFPMDVWLNRMNEDRPGVKIVGGMVSGISGPRDCLLISGQDTYDQGSLVLRFQGDIRLRSLVSQGCRAIGNPFIITKSERNLILELGGKPVLQQVQNLFNGLSQRDRGLMRQGLHFGRVVDERMTGLPGTEYLIRNVVGIDEDSNGLVVGDYVRNGQSIQFHLRDMASAQLELQNLLSLHARNRKSHLIGGLSFTCNGRGTRLFNVPHHDSKLIQDFLGPLPIAGFFAAGEIGPIGSHNFLHGFTNSVALFERAGDGLNDNPTNPRI